MTENPIDKKKIGKKIYRIIAAAVLATGLLVSGLSLAYFSGTDEVTNRHNSNDVSIELFEPNWTATGNEMALKQVPGMEIPKDPQVLNTSKQAVYVRLKIEINGADGEAVSTERKTKILRQIYSGDNVILSDGKSTNANFYYDDGWFYYIDSTAGEDSTVFKTLAANKSTPALFDTVKIPVLKTDYNGVFDTAYSIDITAQAIAQNSVSDGKVIEAFKEKYGDS